MLKPVNREVLSRCTFVLYILLIYTTEISGIVYFFHINSHGSDLHINMKPFQTLTKIHVLVSCFVWRLEWYFKRLQMIVNQNGTQSQSRKFYNWTTFKPKTKVYNMMPPTNYRWLKTRLWLAELTNECPTEPSQNSCCITYFPRSLWFIKSCCAESLRKLFDFKNTWKVRVGILYKITQNPMQHIFLFLAWLRALLRKNMYYINVPSEYI